MQKLLPIITLVLLVLSLGLSGTAAFMSYSALNKINETAVEPTANTNPDKVPITQLTTYEFEESLIHTYLSSDGEKTMNMSLPIGIGLDSENEASADELTTITEKSGLLRDRIAKLLGEKTFEYMSQDGVEEVLQQEILTIIIEELQSESIVEVYFPDGLITSIR